LKKWRAKKELCVKKTVAHLEFAGRFERF